jgi:cell division initiation protein
MALTPVDILHTQFKGAIRGYNKNQVDEFVRSVRESMEEIIKDKTELQRKVDTIEDELERIRKIESAMSAALTVAQQSADELKANAHRQAEAIIKEAEQGRVQMTVNAQKEIERLRSEIAMLESTRDRFESEFRTTLVGYLDWLDKRRPAVDVPDEVVARDEVVAQVEVA